MLSPLDKIRSKVSGKEEDSDITTSIYYLVKELHCLPEILGREFEIEYEEIKIFWKFKWFRIKRIRQKPISIPSLMVLFKEMEADYKRQEKEMKKAKRGKR